MNFIKLASSATLLQVVNLGMPVVFSLLIVKIYGISAFGVYTTLFSAIAIIAALIEFGLNTYGVANLGRCTNLLEKKELFINITKSKIFLLLIAIPIYYTIVELISMPDLNLLGSLGGLLYLFGCAINSTWFSYHSEKIIHIVLLTLLARASALVALMIFPTSQAGINFPILINSLSFLFSGALSFFISLRYIENYGVNKINKTNVRDLLHKTIIPARHLAMTSIFVVIYTSLGVVIVSQVLGASAAGLIGFAERIIRAIQSTLSGISTSALAKSLVMTNAQNNQITKYQIYLYLFSGLLLYSTADFILGLFPKINGAEALSVLQAYAIVLVVGGTSSVLSLYFFVRTHNYRLQTYVTAAGAVLSPSLVFFASKTYGVIGSAYSVMMVEVIVLIVTFYFIKYRELQ